jgi:hypothetical protein
MVERIEVEAPPATPLVIPNISSILFRAANRRSNFERRSPGLGVDIAGRMKDFGAVDIWDIQNGMHVMWRLP